MFNIGTGELILIAVVALLVLGPKRLPELARGLGKFLREFRRQTDEVRNVVEREFYRMDEEDKKLDAGGKKAEAPKLVPAPGAEPKHVSPGGDDTHNPDGTLKAPPAAPALPAEPAAPAAEAPPAGDHLPPADDVKSQLTAGLDHSDPAHPDYGKDEPKPAG